jgi:hypothetical protein
LQNPDVCVGENRAPWPAQTQAKTRLAGQALTGPVQYQTARSSLGLSTNDMFIGFFPSVNSRNGIDLAAGSFKR